jgi:hypothetical protein
MGGPKNLPYLDLLNILDLTKLTNDPILPNPSFPNIPTKLPSHITKFDGKLYKGLPNHVMMFHLWLSSKHIIDDSIFL